MIKIIIAGFKGKMGSTAVDMVINHPDFVLTGVLDPHSTEKVLLDKIPVFQSKEEMITEVTADVWIDFTIPTVAYENTKFALTHGIAPVVGTTGFTEEQIEELTKLSKAKKTGGLIAPNFGIGAVLMMEFAQKAAAYFPDVEIIELHHDQKLDAPSGTAIKTAEMIAEVRSFKEQGNPAEEEVIKGARGANVEGMHIHSVRLPGLVAHQQVQFGAAGEGLTIRHDSYDRQSFMSGVALGCEKVVALDHLVYGLDKLI